MRLLDEHGVRATFFILGWVADRQPRLIEEIAAAGHEIATHGYWHELVYRQQPAEFARDLEQSAEAIVRACGQPPSGYRAPSFSITPESMWALDIIQKQGLRYDSSMFPLTWHDRYGISGANRFAHQTPGGLWEFPVSTVRLLGCNWPALGGGYFRLYPLWLTHWALKHLNAAGRPAVVYLHPWEFDPAQPQIAGASGRSRFRHRVNLHATESRLATLLQNFDFAPLCRVFEHCFVEHEIARPERRLLRSDLRAAP